MRFPSERAYSRQIVEMCQAFAQLGQAVTLAVNTRKTHISQVPEAYYGYTFDFLLRRFWTPDLARFGKIGFAVSTTIFLVECIRHVMSHTYDLTYCRSEWILAGLEIILPQTKKVYESHEAKFSAPVRFLFRRGVKCVAISEGIANYYTKKGIPKEQIIVAHDAISDDFFVTPEDKTTARTRLGLPLDQIIAMYIGGFDEWKGVETFAEAGELSSTITFVAIGGKPDTIQSFQATYPHVLFLGERPYTELKDNQQAADVLVIPNTAKNKLSAEYTSPLKLFAHLTSKVPLVVSDIPSMRHVVSKNEVIFVPSDDARALSEGVVMALDQDVVLDRPDKAYELAKEYTWQKRAEKILNFVTA